MKAWKESFKNSGDSHLKKYLKRREGLVAPLLDCLLIKII